MQCVATLASGSQCTRPAQPDSPTCARHSARPDRPASFYAPRFPAPRRKVLAAAAHLDGLAQEIPVLRTLISDAAAAGDLDRACRGIEALARVIRSERLRPASDDLATWLEETLDELDAEPSLKPPAPVIPPRHLGRS